MLSNDTTSKFWKRKQTLVGNGHMIMTYIHELMISLDVLRYCYIFLNLMNYYSVTFGVGMAYMPALGINTCSKDPTKSTMR